MQEHQENLPLDGVTFEDIAENLQSDLDLISKRYCVDILSAVSFQKMDNAGVFFVGNPNTVIQLGLAKIIENKFKE